MSGELGALSIELGGPRCSLSAMFDPETGFPQNVAAEAKIAQCWSEELKLGSSHRSDSDIHFTLPYKTLSEATRGFAQGMRIGGGAFSVVYKAEVFGVEVAVKALTDAEGMDEKKKTLEEKQFMAEQRLLKEVLRFSPR